MAKLTGKVAVVTGGNSGMGLVTAKRFAAEGAHVFITGRRQAELEAAAREIGANVTAVQGDVSRPGDLDRLYATVKEQAGGVDVLFANAGIARTKPLGEITEADFDELFGINVKGLLFTVQKALPLFRDGGSIILNASVASSKGFEGATLYSASKAAVRSFTRTWANELKGRQIRVNTLSPGPIETPIFDSMAPGQSESVKQGFASMVPLGRLGTSEEIANVVLFLACDDSSYVNGIELYVDGGMIQV